MVLCHSKVSHENVLKLSPYVDSVTIIQECISMGDEGRLLHNSYFVLHEVQRGTRYLVSQSNRAVSASVVSGGHDVT